MERAQSEAIGTVLMVAIVVVTVTIWGSFQLARAGDIQDDVLLDVQPETTTNASLPETFSALELGHNGGDSIALADLKLIVRKGDGTKSCEKLFDTDGTVTGPDNTWDGGEIWSPSGSCKAWTPGGVVRLLVIYEPTPTTVYDERWDVDP